MTMRVALVLDGNASGAKAALQQTATEVDKLTAATNAQTAAAQANVMANARALQSNGNVANIAAQFQDIAVTSAMGMSPLQIALQQGTQLSAVLGQQGAAGAAKALVAALGSLISPVSLITIGIVALGSAAIQAFGGMLTSASKATMSLEEHDKWLKEILTGYDSAAKAAKAASDAAQSLPKGSILSELDSQLKRETDAYEASIQALKTANIARNLSELELYETASSKTNPAIAAQRDALVAMKAAIDAGNPSLAELHQQLTEIKNSAADDVIASIAQQMLSLVTAARDAAAQLQATSAAAATLYFQPAVARFSSDMDATTMAIGKMKALVPDLRTAYQQNDDALKDALKNAPTGMMRYAAEKQYADTKAALDAQKAQQAALRAEKTAAKVDPYEAASKNVADRTAQLALEISLVGKNTFEVEKLRKAEELKNAAVEAGMKLTPQVLKHIDEKSAAFARSTVQLQNAQSVFQDIQRVGESAFDTILNAALSGSANIKDVIASIGKEYAKLALNMALFNPMKNALFGGGNGVADSGIGGGIASFVASLFGFGKGAGGVTGGAALDGAALPRREAGGPVVAGQAYLVGERRPEIFVPTSSGTIIPNTSMLASAGGGGLQFHQTIINRNGSDVQTRQRRQPDGSVYQELVIDATQEGMANDRYRQFGIRGPTKSR